MGRCVEIALAVGQERDSQRFCKAKLRLPLHGVYELQLVVQGASRL